MLNFNQILDGQGETLVPFNHLTQIITFALGTGVDFIPVKDVDGMRKGLIEQVCERSQIEINSPAWLAQVMKRGRLLLYLRPDGRLYQIHAYPKGDYRIEQQSDGQYSQVQLLYAYHQRQESGSLTPRWVRLRITANLIERQESDHKPNLDQPFTPDSVLNNDFGFIPCVEVLNPPPAGGDLGMGDFDQISGQIEVHNDLVSGILDKLYFYAESPIVTSRDPGEIQEALFKPGGDSWEDRESVAYASGFRESGQKTSRSRNRRHKLRRIIGNIEPDEMFQQWDIDPIPQDHIAYAGEYERQLRETLGGILERGIETATESRVVYGKVAVTAKYKQIALFKYGICRLLSMALLAEEALYVSTGGRMGLPYMGDRTINYRVGAVYQPTTRDTLDRSIVSRNLMRQGVNAKEALKYVFPEKSEQEIAQMVGSGGLPSEYLRDAIGIVQQISTLFDPVTGLPLTDPRTGVPLVQTVLPFIINALSYGQQFYSDTRQQPQSTASAAAESGALNAAPLRLARLAAIATRSSNGVVPANNQPASGMDAPPVPGVTTGSAPTPTSPFSNFLNIGRSPILNWLRGAGQS
jgi:hypothetical protein